MIASPAVILTLPLASILATLIVLSLWRLTAPPCKDSTLIFPGDFKSIAPFSPMAIAPVSILPLLLVRLILALSLSIIEISLVRILPAACKLIVLFDCNSPPVVIEPPLAIATSPPLISLVTISPTADKITCPPAEIVPTVIELEEIGIEVKFVSPKVVISPVKFGEFAKLNTPERKIKAGPLLKIAISGSTPGVKVRSGPVISIFPPIMLPFVSTFSDTPV